MASTRFISPRNSVFKLLILSSLLWLQIACASHEMAHSVDDLGESCFVCLSVDRAGHALDDNGVIESATAGASDAVPIRPERNGAAHGLRVYSARASPG